ncbi:DUF5050 domain-containing protein [Neobacillus sp. BF23-41]|uniref:DUF5050 domain-containing protein n=1 Tax=Neobacillus sp. BF23-41 TaxID=3240280 RepID=UPI0034E3BD70
MNRNLKLSYIVQPVDNLYSIALKFNTSVESIVFLNHLVSPIIYIGQTLLIPEPVSKKGIEARQLQYKPVTAYTADRPILVNGVDINTGLYPVLNFQPTGATYPFIYVPIAEFSRVGAKVVWDETNQVIRVTSDYDELKNRVNVLTQENQYLLSLTGDLSMEGLGNTAGNILNSGIVGKENEWLYYNKRQGTALYGTLSIIKTDLTMDTPLMAKDDPTYINVLNGWVYYRNGRDNGKIYKIKIDSTERTKLTDDSSTDIMVAGNWIYYANQSDGAKLYKLNVDGTGRIKLNEDQSSAINLIGNWIYYQNVSDGQKPYKVKIDGSKKTKLNDTSAYNIQINGYWIYFRNPADENRIYKMTLDGSNKIKLSDVPTSTFNVSNGWIYYTTVDVPGGDLYKMKLDGTGKTFLNEHFVTNTNIFDDWIYYTRTEKMVYRIKTDGTQKQTLY